MRVTRREVLAGGALAAMPAVAFSQQSARKRQLQVAHLTDIHVQPERKGGDGMAACLEHVNQLDDKPDFIMFGGDNIMDALGADKTRVQTQWDLFMRTLRGHNGLPYEVCFGNHDLWRGNGGAGLDEPLSGQKWGMELLEMESPYHAFARGGWEFIVLDSTMLDGGGYKGRLSDEQFEWLAGELDRTKDKNTIIVSHIPILGACTFFDGDNEKSGDWQVPGAWMHIDARRIKDLFHKHPQVKVALSGHIHLVDRVDYLGVTYLCNGAVSGGWWSGDYQEFGPGYALVDLYDDGSVECSYESFGWTPKD